MQLIPETHSLAPATKTVEHLLGFFRAMIGFRTHESFAQQKSGGSA